MPRTDEYLETRIQRTVEQHLRYYPLYRAFVERYEEEREDIIERQSKPEVGHARGRGSIVETKALQLEKLDARYAYRRRWVQGIEDVLATLSKADRRYVELRYFAPENERLPEHIIARELHCCRDTLRARRQAIITAVAVRMGLM